MFKLHFLLILGLFLVTKTYASSPSSPSYIGAVVEYRPLEEGEDGLKIAEQNAINVRTIVKKASEYHVDIIVFPEVGLTSLPVPVINVTTDKIRADYYKFASYIPEPNDRIVLCGVSGEYSKALKSISCAAKEFQLYIVVNHYEKFECTISKDCPNDGFLLYNTNVVFDRNGRLVARYRKYNLFYEPGIDITAEPELSIFDTDFGVKFGQIICNDILYTKPAIELVKLNVTDIAYSAKWYSELPFLTSVETHSAWALAYDVNVLSSGYNEPAITNGGSGIYLGKRGIVKATQPNIPANILVIAEIPKVINGVRQNLTNPTKPTVYTFSQDEIPTNWDNADSFMYKDVFDLYRTEVIDPRHKFFSKKLCNRGLCCDFKIESGFDEALAASTNADYYRYRIGVFNGTRLFAGAFTVGIEVCGLFFCRNDTLASCGERFVHARSNIVEPTTFYKVVIERTISNDDEKFYLPMTLTNALMSIDASKLSYKKTRKSLKMTLKTAEKRLFAFAIYGRNLLNDDTELTRL